MAIALIDNIAALDSTVSVTDADYATRRFPFHAYIDSELVLVTGGGYFSAASGGTYKLGIQRGIENTTRATHTAGTEIEPAPPAGAVSGGIELSPEHSGTGSFQTFAGDLNLAAAAGSSTDSKYLAGVMGNLIGDTLTKTKTYLAGVIGKFSVTGTRATTYPAAAVAGEVGDGVTTADAAFVAVLGGDSAQTNARAAFTVDDQNTTPGSGFDYGLDAQGNAAHDSYGAVGYLKAPVRLGGDVCLLFGSAAPTDGAAGTGAAFAGPGSVYFRTGAGSMYVNANTKASPTWKLVTQAA